MDESEQINTNGAGLGITSVEPSRPQQKLKKRVWLIVAIVLLSLGIMGVILWSIFSANYGTYTAEKDSETSNIDSDVNQGTDSEVVENGIAEVSVNDFFVRNLYHQSRSVRGWFNLLDNNIDAQTMLSMAINNIDSFICSKEYSYFQGFENQCFRSDDLFDKVYELFGQPLDETANYNVTAFYCDAYTYNKEDKVFYHSGGGCSGTRSGSAQALYKAEKDNEHLYLYNVRSGFSFVPSGFTEGDELTIDSVWDEVRFYRSSNQSTAYEQMEAVPNLVFPAGDFLRTYGSGAISAVEATFLLDYIDQLDKFKWTFAWNGESYIFESLEKI